MRTLWVCGSKTLKWAMLLMLLLAGALALPQCNWQGKNRHSVAEAQEQAISIELVMEKRTFLSGEPVPVTIRMKNVSNRRLITDQLFKRGTERIDKLAHYIHVVDSTGDRLSPMYPADAPGIPDGRPEVIGPDWTRTVSLSDLREHVRFLNKAGTYTVQVRFGLCLYEAIRADGSIPWQSPSWSGIIESNKLTFTILERRAERPQPSFEEREEAATFTAGLEAMGERDIPAAIPKLEEALQSAEEPEEWAKTNLLLGLAYMWNDELDEAIAASEVVVAFDPDLTVSFPDQGMHHLNPMAGLADCYRIKALKGGESASAAWASALHWAQKLLEHNPDAEAQMLIAEEARRKLAQAGQRTMGPMVVAGGYYVRGPVHESNDRLLVPATELTQRLGVVAKAGSPGQVELASDAHRLLLSAGSRQAVLDGATITLPVAPAMVKDKLLIPLRFVAEAFGHRVDWEALPRIAWVR